MTKKTLPDKTLMVSAECYGELCSLQTLLCKIFNKKAISFSQIIRFLIHTKTDYAEVLTLLNEPNCSQASVFPSQPQKEECT